MPIPARPLKAFSEIAKDGMQMIMVGPFPTPHADKINTWFEHRYGDRLLMDFSPGKAVVLIWGDPYVIRLPRIYGHWKGTVDATKTYVGMTKELFASLPERDRNEMIAAFIWFLERYNKIEKLPKKILANIDIAIQLMTSQDPHYGESKWASLQTAEKTLKEFISSRHGTYRKVHILSELLILAEGLGLPSGYWPILGMIQCKPDVRYEDGVTLEQAVLAHHAAIDLCAFIAEHYKNKKIAGVAPTEKIDDIVISFGHAVDMNYNGGLLFRFVMADGKEKLLLFSSDACYFLRDQIRKSLKQGRHPDERADLLLKRNLCNLPPRHAIRTFLANQPELSQKDFESTAKQVQGCNAADCTNGIQFDFSLLDGDAVRLIMDSVVVNYFADYLDGGIKAGYEHGLFKC